jgi:zinc D-Ala-D-Ala carboxypeptidase
MKKLKYFTAADFRMDGQDVSDKMNPAFLDKLDKCRELAGFPFVLTSSFRSPEKNASIGGATYSMHLSGRAVDVRVVSGDQRWRIVRAAIILGLSVGIMENAVHIDDRDGIPVLFHYYASKRRTD